MVATTGSEQIIGPPCHFLLEKTQFLNGALEIIQ